MHFLNFSYLCRGIPCVWIYLVSGGLGSEIMNCFSWIVKCGTFKIITLSTKLRNIISNLSLFRNRGEGTFRRWQDIASPLIFSILSV